MGSGRRKRWKFETLTFTNGQMWTFAIDYDQSSDEWLAWIRFTTPLERGFNLFGVVLRGVVFVMPNSKLFGHSSPVEPQILAGTGVTALTPTLDGGSTGRPTES